MNATKNTLKVTPGRRAANHFVIINIPRTVAVRIVLRILSHPEIVGKMVCFPSK